VNVNTTARGARKILGLLLIATGLLLILALFYIAPYGLVAGLAFSWIIAILICTGSFLLLNVNFRKSLSPLFAVLLALILWSSIFLVQLPGSMQILLASVVGFASVLLYRVFKAKKSGSHRL
jgi:hypothetical protein